MPKGILHQKYFAVAINGGGMKLKVKKSVFAVFTSQEYLQFLADISEIEKSSATMRFPAYNVLAKVLAESYGFNFTKNTTLAFFVVNLDGGDGLYKDGNIVYVEEIVVRKSSWLFPFLKSSSRIRYRVWILEAEIIEPKEVQ